MHQTKFHARHLVQVEVPVLPLLLNITKTIHMGEKMHHYNRKRKTLQPNYCRHLCARLLQIGDHQPPQSNDVGHIDHKMRQTQIVSKMAFFRVDRDDIQSRVSVPFSQFTMNLVTANPSKLPNTLEAISCKHCLNKRRSKHG